MVHQRSDVRRQPVHRARFRRGIAFAKAAQIRSDDPIIAAQCRDLVGPERAVEWIAVDEHDRMTGSGGGVRHLKVVDASVGHVILKVFSAKAKSLCSPPARRQKSTPSIPLASPGKSENPPTTHAHDLPLSRTP